MLSVDSIHFILVLYILLLVRIKSHLFFITMGVWFSLVSLWLYRLLHADFLFDDTKLPEYSVLTTQRRCLFVRTKISLVGHLDFLLLHLRWKRSLSIYMATGTPNSRQGIFPLLIGLRFEVLNWRRLNRRYNWHLSLWRQRLAAYVALVQIHFEEAFRLEGKLHFLSWHLLFYLF